MRWQLLLTFLFFFIKGYSQKQENEYKKMIDSAISITCQKIFKPNKILSANSTLDGKDLYLIDESNFPYNYTGMFAGLGFKGINVLDPKNKTVIKKGIRAWKVIPTLQDRSLKIKIIDFFITYKNANYNFANGGGSETTFEYSCNTNKWVLIKSEYQGL